MVIHEEQTRSGVACDEDVSPTVLVEIRSDHRHAVGLSGGRDSGLLGHVGERAVSVVAVEGMSSGGQSTGPTLHGNTFPVAVHILAGYGRMFKREADVVRNEKIEVAIAVVIKETASRAPAWLIAQKAGRLGHVSKRSIAIVAVKTVLTKIGAEDVFEAVVVVVPDADAGGPAHGLQSCLLGDVGESAVAVVFVKAIGGARRITGQAGAG